ncbi:MAG: AbrB/MazE/SpoVT family DNA-binding domain-containing protein [Candidatus Kerfeldbacteria bacterium]
MGQRQQKQQRKGTCGRMKACYGFVSVTDKGQLAIPIELRRELGIEKGDKLIVIKRGDGKGVNLIKSDAVEEFLNKYSKE